MRAAGLGGRGCGVVVTTCAQCEIPRKLKASDSREQDTSLAKERCYTKDTA